MDKKALEKLLNELKGKFPAGSKFEMALKESEEYIKKNNPGAWVSYKIMDPEKAEMVSVFLKRMGISTSISKSNGAAFFVAAAIGAWQLDQAINMDDAGNCGTNTMCLFAHEWPVSIGAGVRQQSKMSKDTSKLLVELSGSKPEGQFYFASPCKANLNVAKGKCTCNQYYDSDKKYSEIVIDLVGLKCEWCTNPRFTVDQINDCYKQCGTLKISDEQFTVLNSFKVNVSFPHKFKFEQGKIAEFKYSPEGGAEREDSLKGGDIIDDPKRLEDALRTMKKEDLERWVNANAKIVPTANIQEFRFSNAIHPNFESGVAYKKCIKGGEEWFFWGDKPAEYDCIKISAEDEKEYRPNYCFEAKGSVNDVAESAVLLIQVGAGLAAAGLASETGPGAMYAYCGASMAVSVAGAWVLSGVEAKDKWPNGISERIIH